MDSTRQAAEELGKSPETALYGLVLFAGGLTLAPLAMALAHRIFPGRNVFFARWGFSHAGIVALTTLALIAIASALLGPSAEAPGALVSLAVQSAIFACAGLLVVVIAQRLEPAGWRALGFWPGKNLRAALVGVSAYTLLLPALFGLTVAWPWLFERLGGDFRPQEIGLRIREVPPGELWAALALAVIVVPFLEELLFRGFLQPLLVQNLGDRGGVAACSAMFAILHDASAFLPIFALALVLGAVQLRTQRLVACWLVHALHNGLMVARLFATDREALAPAGAALAWAGSLLP
ncbi:MAG TPA: type II CAAX endopeptidase family protein [Planctomycetota bacterium]|nr:type II CAAX endopeptidase family protein [Planctomycetota bacterium]